MATYDLSLKTPDWRQFQDDVVVYWNADVRSFLRDVESVKPTPKEIMDLYAPAAEGQMSSARAGDLRAAAQRLWEQRIRELIGQKSFPTSGTKLRHEDVWMELLTQFRNETGTQGFSEVGKDSKQLYQSVKNWEKRNPQATAQDAYNWILKNVYNPAIEKFNEQEAKKQSSSKSSQNTYKIAEKTKIPVKREKPDLSKLPGMKIAGSTQPNMTSEQLLEDTMVQPPPQNQRGRFGFNTMFEPGGPTRMPPAWS